MDIFEQIEKELNEQMEIEVIIPSAYQTGSNDDLAVI